MVLLLVLLGSTNGHFGMWMCLLKGGNRSSALFWLWALIHGAGRDTGLRNPELEFFAGNVMFLACWA